MNTVQKRALEDAQNGINIAPDTQTAIRFIAVHYDKVTDKLRLMEEEKNKQQETEEQPLEFDPEEIETLVYRENNFKKELSVKPTNNVNIKKESYKTQQPERGEREN